MAVRINDTITFIHIGKNAGTSISNLLDKNFTTKHSPGTHDTFHQLPIEWQDKCFCVIRNPYDRLLSLYHFTMKKMKKLYNEKFFRKSFYDPQLEILEQGFENFVLNHATTTFYTKPLNTNRQQPWSQKTQIRFLPDDKTKIQILRFENLNDDWASFCREHNLQHHNLLRENSSRDDNSYQDHYNEKMIDTVKKNWKQDLELGSYEF